MIPLLTGALSAVTKFGKGAGAGILAGRKRVIQLAQKSSVLASAAQAIETNATSNNPDILPKKDEVAVAKHTAWKYRKEDQQAYEYKAILSAIEELRVQVVRNNEAIRKISDVEKDYNEKIDDYQNRKEAESQRQDQEDQTEGKTSILTDLGSMLKGLTLGLAALGTGVAGTTFLASISPLIMAGMFKGYEWLSEQELFQNMKTFIGLIWEQVKDITWQDFLDWKDLMKDIFTSPVKLIQLGVEKIMDGIMWIRDALQDGINGIYQHTIKMRNAIIDILDKIIPSWVGFEKEKWYGDEKEQLWKEDGAKWMRDYERAKEDVEKGRSGRYELQEKDGYEYYEKVDEITPEMLKKLQETRKKAGMDNVVPYRTKTTTPKTKVGTMAPTVERSILNEIAEGEGTSDEMALQKGFNSGYDVTLGYGAYVDRNKYPKPLTEMTLDEINKMQLDMLPNPQNSTAVGKYQIVRRTLLPLRDQLNLKGSDKFTPELQDRLAMHLMKGRGFDKMISGEMSINDFQDNLSKEWASVANTKTGKSFYGQATGTLTDEIRPLLEAARSPATAIATITKPVVIAGGGSQSAPQGGGGLNGYQPQNVTGSSVANDNDINMTYGTLPWLVAGNM